MTGENPVDRIAAGRIALHVLALVLFGTAAMAETPTKGNLFFGYSYSRAGLGHGRVNLDGWNGSLDWKVLPWLGLLADISGHYGSEGIQTMCFPPSRCPFPPPIHAGANMYSFLLGSRLSGSIDRVIPFAQVLVGAVHLNASGSGFSDSQNSYAPALGGGVDYRIFHGIDWRVQTDWLRTRFFTTMQNDLRPSTGPVFRF
jgi:hypothetical protein